MACLWDLKKWATRRPRRAGDGSPRLRTSPKGWGDQCSCAKAGKKSRLSLWATQAFHSPWGGPSALPVCPFKCYSHRNTFTDVPELGVVTSMREITRGFTLSSFLVLWILFQNTIQTPHFEAAPFYVTTSPRGREPSLYPFHINTSLH